jgi:hypothetical protein
MGFWDDVGGFFEDAADVVTDVATGDIGGALETVTGGALPDAVSGVFGGGGGGGGLFGGLGGGIFDSLGGAFSGATGGMTDMLGGALSTVPGGASDGVFGAVSGIVDSVTDTVTDTFGGGGGGMFGGLWDTATSFVEGVAGGGSGAPEWTGGFMSDLLSDFDPRDIVSCYRPSWEPLSILDSIPDSWTEPLPGLGGMSEVGGIFGGAFGDLADGELPDLDDVVDVVVDTAQDTVLDGLGIPGVDEVIDTVQTFAEDFSPDKLMDLGRDLLGDAVELPDSIDGLVSSLASGDTGGLLDNLLGAESPLGGLGEFVDGLGVGAAGDLVDKLVGDNQIGRLLTDIGGDDVADLLGKVAQGTGLSSFVENLDPAQTTQLIEKLVGQVTGAAGAAGVPDQQIGEEAVAFAGSGATAGVAAAEASSAGPAEGDFFATIGEAIDDGRMVASRGPEFVAADDAGDVLGVDAATAAVAAIDEPVVAETGSIDAVDEVDVLAPEPASVAPEPVLVEEPVVVEPPPSELTTAVEAADQVEEGLDDMFDDLQ